MPDPAPPSPPPGPKNTGAPKSAPGASEAREGKGVYKYLPIECPNCGFQGKVNISRLDQTFHCKECNQVFHVTRDGTVAGERPADAVPVSHTAAPVEEQPTWVEKRFQGLPPAAKWVVLGIFGLALAYGAVRLLEPAEPLPGELSDRALLAGKAFAKGEWSTLKRLAAKRTGGDLGKWYDKQRPADWSDADPESIQVNLGAVRKQLLRYEKTTPIMTVRTKVDIAVPEKQSGEIELIWSETETGEFWLDGEKMLKESRLIKKKATPKPPPEEENAEEPKEADAEPAA
ncbi:MAG TPA: hypothetical protein VHC22_14695 [Pirellulales bacterium]|nr:hypothetical protein [Pirellulales bacterium]